jgi:outer membrane protein OmpA-like peptidoglycan-associated protein
MNNAFVFLVVLFALNLHVAAQSLIAHYPLSGHANDVSGNKNDGIVVGGVMPTADRFGNYCGAMMFNGIDGYIAIPDSKSLSLPGSAYSVTAWCKLNVDPTGNNYRWLTIICKGDLSVELPDIPHYRLQIFQGNTQSTISISSEFTKNDYAFKDHTIDYDQWYFLSVTYDGALVKLYLNEVLVWSEPYRGYLSKNNQSLNIGRDVPGVTEFFSGALSDLRIFDYALSERDVKKLFFDSKSFGVESAVDLVCQSDMIMQSDKGACGGFASFSAPEVITHCGKSTIKQLAGPVSGAYVSVGTEKIVYRIDNTMGNNRLCSFSLTIKDNEPPRFVNIKDTVLLVKKGEPGIVYKYEMPDAKDNCAIKSLSLLDGLVSGQMFPLGRNILKFQALDVNNNASTVVVAVDVIELSDLIEPQLQTVNIDKDKITTPPLNIINFDSIPLQIGLTIELSDILFDADRTGLLKSSTQQLDSLAGFLLRNPQVVVEIGGHTNGIPSDAYCFRLSEGRAKTCVNYLIAKGVNKANLRYRGYGKTKLKLPDQPSNQANQRVEISIIEIK